MESLREIFFKTDRTHYSMFDVGRSMLDVHQFLSRFDWTLAASGDAYMKLQMFGAVGRATVPAETGRHGGRPYDSTRPKFLFRLTGRFLLAAGLTADT